jgi:phospholipid/cholesterol/gamma-HCH transport system substrate-binding protein
MRASLRLSCALTAAGLVVSGCAGGGLQSVTLPGGADLGDDPYALTIEFADVLELVPQSLVKVNDVNVGTVTGIRVSPGYTALVEVAINGGVRIPADAIARVSQTSLLGEKFVAIDAPPGRRAADPGPEIADGATIPLARTSAAAEVEQVLGALSMLLNGGGVAQIRDIAVELNTALGGNEDEIRALLGDLDELVGGLDDRKTEITRALDELNRLSSVLRERRGQIDVALDDIAPGLRELENQRGRLVELLRSLDELSDVATDVVDRSREDVVDDLTLLRPILRKLAESGDDLPKSLELVGSIPFTNDALEVFAGDYANLYVTVDADLGVLLGNLLGSPQPLGGPDVPLLPPQVPDAPSAPDLLAPLRGATPLPAPPDFPLLATPVPADPLDLPGGGS